MDYETEQQGYDDESRAYRERSRSPRQDNHGNGETRARSNSPSGRDRIEARPPPPAPPEEDEEAARNSGSNLFVTGIHPRLTEEDITRLFEKYGDVEKCNIMRDPHTRESRGFGFVNMMNSQQADAAKEGLQGEVYEGRTLSIEKARRSRPRTPTPGKYFGPPKRDDFRGPPRRGFYEERRGGYGRRDDSYSSRGSRYGGDRYDDRYYGRRERHDDGYRGDRYRDDRYGGRRGGGGGDYYERGSGGGRQADSGSYGEPMGTRDYGGGGRPYDDRADDRYSSRR